MTTYKEYAAVLDRVVSGGLEKPVCETSAPKPASKSIDILANGCAHWLDRDKANFVQRPGLLHSKVAIVHFLCGLGRPKDMATRCDGKSIETAAETLRTGGHNFDRPCCGAWMTASEHCNTVATVPVPRDVLHGTINMPRRSRSAQMRIRS